MHAIVRSSGCPLCSSDRTTHYYRDKRRAYLRCKVCLLIFVPYEEHLSEAEEKSQYDLHQNDPYDASYRRFLGRLADPLLDRLEPGSKGLDFGSGPGPALQLIMEEAGHAVANYDKFYAVDDSLLKQRYDFITATEVVEHLREPRETLNMLWSCLYPHGYLGLMTKRAHGLEAFSNWHYKNDPTHIAFFSEETFLWLAEQWQAHCDFVGADTVILQKPGA